METYPNERRAQEARNAALEPRRGAVTVVVEPAKDTSKKS